MAKKDGTIERGLTAGTRRALNHGAAAVVLAVACGVPSAVAAVTAQEPVVLRPPEPTGDHAVGRVDLELVDEGRGHPWVEGSERREIMLSVWYPARQGGGAPRAPYASGAVADYLLSQVEKVGLSRDAVDVDGSRTNARLGADVAADAEAGSLPVLVYSHGFNQTRYQATAQLEELASQGYVVVAMDHPYESIAVELADGRVVRSAVPEEMGATEMYRETIGVRQDDVRFVLDTLERAADGAGASALGRVVEGDDGAGEVPQGLVGAMDLSSVGMFGHSAGGFTAAELMVVEDRIDAGVDLDGSIGYHVPDEVWGRSNTLGSSRPFMIMGGGWSSGGYPHTSRESPDWGMFRAASTGPTVEVYLEEGEHMSFIDTQWYLRQLEEEADPSGPAWERTVEASIGTIDPERSVAAQRAYLTAFFDEYLRGEEQALLDGPSPEHPDAELIDPPA
ncbi:alpha/beta hydrolase [Nocardiopsis sp. RSe5-2]|uniref:Alpha/beta hydrolase n=1 Tax=Nocardiopsis endophytica TaxID=3018445 RepID=A0ABT4UD16_9ACTN|nr:alpha/beta hydrolase [Nocardiopsis endophytica]MDA2814815.1 alpha/beta hydrolase [Nocardiopsis endophytica]